METWRRLTLTVLFTVALQGMSLTPLPISTQAARVRLRIGVISDNLYRITSADLSAAGVNPAEADPATFAMSSLGQPVAIRVVDDGDASFDDGEYIEFFGERFRGPTLEEAYTDERVYWLDIGGAPGPRVADVSAAPQGDLTPPAEFPTTVHAEQNTIYWALWSLNYDTEDTWFWGRLGSASGTGVITTTLTYTTPDPAPGYPAALRLEEIGRSTGIRRTTITIGSTLLKDQSWSGAVRKVITATVPAGLLTGATTNLVVGAPGDGDDVHPNYWEVDYRRRFRAFGDQLDFEAETAGAQEFSVPGFSGNQVAVWEITDPNQPSHLTGAQVTSDGSGGYAVRFRAAPAAGDRFWLQTAGSFATPASVTLRGETNLRAPDDPLNTGPGADTVIVIPDVRQLDLRPAADRLAAWHRGHGRRTVVVDLQDAYDEFNDGIRHPKAVRAMMTWAASHWQAPAPTYLVLIGDGHYNMKGYNPALYKPAPDLMPPYLGFYDPWQGEVASDGLFGDTNGDDLPEVAVGRLNATSLVDANVMVDKIIAYDETIRAQPWQQRAIFVANKTDPFAGNFQALSDDIIQNYLPADLAPQRIYYSGSPDTPGNATAAIRDGVNAGALMLQYTGHGSYYGWTNDTIWKTDNVSSLTNSTQLPVAMTFNCLDGYFIHPDLVNPSQSRQGLAEVMLRHPTGGLVAAVSSTGLSITSDQDSLRRILMGLVFQDGVQDLGRAVQLTKQRYYADSQHGTGKPLYLLYTLSFFGDPALRIPVACVTPASPASLAIAGNAAGVTLTWSAALDASEYRVWRSGDDPYFTVDPAVTTPYSTTQAIDFNGTRLIDPDSVPDPAHDRYYAVASFNTCAHQGGIVAKRVGQFTFALTPGQ